MIRGAYSLPDRKIPIEIDGLLFNTPQAEWELRVNEWEGWTDSPDIDLPSLERLWAHGSYTEDGRNLGRLITLTGTGAVNSIDAAFRLETMLKGLLSSGKPGALIVSDPWKPVQQAMVQRASVTRVKWITPGRLKFQIMLKANDPRQYGLPESYTTGVSKAGGGLSFPLFGGADGGKAGILDFGAPSLLGTVTFFNPGSADTFLAGRVTGFAPSFTVTEVETGGRFRYAAAVPAGQFLTFESSTGAVLANGISDRSGGVVESYWPRVPAGESRTYFYESEGAASKLTLTGAPAWW